MRRSWILASTMPSKSSISYKKTLSNWSRAGSKSLGTAISTIKIGRPFRKWFTSFISSFVTTYSFAPVDEITISASNRAHWSSRSSIALPENFSAKTMAFSWVRLMTVTFFAPALYRFWIASSPILPAPMTSTFLSVKLPKIFLANSTAA